MTAAGVRPTERPVLILVAAAFAALEAGRGIGEVGANTLVLGRLGAEALPYLFLPLGFISMVAALGYGAALGRVRRGRLFSAILVGVAIALIAERAAIATVPELAIPLTWLTVIAAGTIAVTLAWTVATSTFDARQAKRLFPLCTAAAIAGIVDRRRGRAAHDRRARDLATRVACPDTGLGTATRNPTTDRRRPPGRVRRGASRTAARADRGGVCVARRPALLGHLPVPEGG
jgi:hypothetical protein